MRVVTVLPLGLRVEGAQNRVHSLVMAVADRVRPAERIIWVYVMSMNEAMARPDCIAEKEFNDAFVARKISPKLSVIDRVLGHRFSHE